LKGEIFPEKSHLPRTRPPVFDPYYERGPFVKNIFQIKNKPNVCMTVPGLPVLAQYSGRGVYAIR